MSKLQIRVESPDHPGVAGLLADLDAYLAGLYAPEDNHILDVQALRAPDVTMLAAWVDGEPVGCGAVRRMPAEAETDGAPYAEIKRMFVVPSARGQGVAGRVLARLESIVAAEGFARSLLETGRDQLVALRVYERCGYVRRGPFGGYPDNGLSLFYEKRLAA
jgi:putative acetyltransferase